MKKQNKTNTIVFYGKDFSPLEDAYIGYPKETVIVQNKKKKTLTEHTVVAIKDLDCGKILLEILKAFLIDLNSEIKKDTVEIIGHSEKEIDNKDDFALFSPNYLKLNEPNSGNPQEAQPELSEDSEESADKKKSLDEKPRFGNLVGTVRRIYNKIDHKTKLGELLKSVPSLDVKNDAVLKLFKQDVIIKLEISSRFDTFNEKNPELSKHYFLADMLLCGRLDLKFDNKHHVDFDYDSLFDFYMLWVLLENFKDALHKGFFKKYQRFENNDRYLKGSINIARHIKLNAGMDNGCVAYSYRENSPDNAVNHLILAAFDYLREKYEAVFDNNVDNELLSQMNQLKYEIGYPKYSRRELINLNSTPISHPFFSEYRALQQNCLKVLRDEGVSPFGNDDEHLSGILYYVPDLWEDYLINPMNKAMRSLRDYKIWVVEQKKIDVFTDLNGNNGHETQPDYVFYFCENDGNRDAAAPFFILDAKYKRFWLNSLWGEFSSYMFEDYNKCIRDMSSIGAVSTGVVFPVSENEIKNGNLQIAHRFSNINKLSCFYTIPVAVPVVEEKETFSDWQDKMTESLDLTNELLAEIVGFERKQYVDIQKLLHKMNNAKELSSFNQWSQR